MDKALMEEAQFISWIIAMIAGLITAAVAITNFRKSIKERRLDLYWKRANSAKEFVHEMHENQQAGAAISMLDWLFIDKFENFNKTETFTISYSEVLDALPKICSNVYTSKERFIIESFDWFFYYIDRLEQHINEGLFSFENVKYIFYPYYKKIAQKSEPFDILMKERDYLLAPRFWKRYQNDPLLNKIV